MLPRTAKRLSRTTSLLSRQALPRPYRLYSTPSKPLNQPAQAQAQLPRNEYSPEYYQQPQQGPPQRIASIGDEIAAFLKRNVQYTILPTPVPADRRTSTNDAWFADTSSQDLLAVMDACLHNLHDVPRAKSIFSQLRTKKTNSSLLTTRVYNAFIEAYINMATENPVKKVWVDSLWELYEILKSGEEKHTPDSSTYALALIAYHRFHPSSTTSPVPGVRSPSVNDILTDIVENNVSISDVVADRSMASSEEAAEIIQRLSKSAMELSMGSIISELGQAEAIGRHVSDTLDNIPEAVPVLKTKVRVDPNAEGGVVEETEVPFNIDILRKHLAHVKLARRVLSDDVAARQKLLEESVYDLASERLQHQADIFASLGLTSSSLSTDLRQWMWNWHRTLQPKLEEAIKAVTEAESNQRREANANLLSPYLNLIKAERLSLITILETMRLVGSGGIHDGMKTTRALVALGKAVEVEYKATMCRRNKIPVPTTVSGAGPSGSGEVNASTYFSNMGYKNLQERRMVAAKYMDDSEAWTADWTQYTRSKVGGILIDCLMDTAEVERTKTFVDKETGEEKVASEMQPAFHHSYEHVRGQKLGVIRINPAVAERMAKDALRETLHPRHLPMLVKPKPWLSVNNGGYIYNKTTAMRFKESQEQGTYLRHAAAQGNCELVFAGLDVLGSTPWKINNDIFDVVLKVWNSGERLGKMPPATYDEPEPKLEEVEETGKSDIKAKTVFQQRMKAWLQGKANNHSDRCSVNYKIEIARAFLGDTIYLPHNLDFRGRAYPIPPHLNHIGDDLSRGLLKFADAQPLGERGLRWLKIHLANLYGFDKANFDERVKWTEDHLEEIYDSANNPLEGKKWWQQADDPWQCLATCYELKAALDSPDPLAFESSLPVHQDGTCNGLQHYAALGGDARGAAQVNLAAADRPSDVYTHVGTMVEKMLEEDAKKGDKYALMLKGKISRKVVKQTVMTTVYGVTFVGAREQIEKQLKDKKDIPEEECWLAASYLAKKVIHCIGDLFSGATAIQTWLNLCARIISKSIPADRIEEAMTELQVSKRSKAAKSRKNRTTMTVADTRLKKEQMTTVVWTTPLGLPIVQPYRKVNRKQIATKIQTVYISDPSSPAEVNSQKQASAFPPNFIHSLDATHMMLTALECRQEGITFASVHDSYWTHASSIDKMSSVIRDTFIALHSSEVLMKLSEEFHERYKNYKIPLASLRSGTLVKQLVDAGSRIVVTPKQADALSSLRDLLTVSETIQSEVDESQVEAAQKMVKEVEAEATLSSDPEVESSAFEEDEYLEEAEEEEALTGPKPRVLGKLGKGRPKKSIDAEAAMKELMGKFVNLTDILPPLPQKGDFNVATIKKSQYFFS